MKILITYLFGCFILGSCSNNNSTQGLNNATTQFETTFKPSAPILEQHKPDFPAVIIGTFSGRQVSYNLKNNNGNEIIIRGNPVSVPAYGLLFSLTKEGNVQFVQQAENGEKVFYNGSFKILDSNATFIRVECNVKTSDGNSSPTYILTFDKTSNTISCLNNSEPAITLNRLDNSQTTNSSQGQNDKSNSIESDQSQTADGVYSFSDNWGNIVVSINGNSWSGKTIIISGLGSDNDNQNAQYENGVVKGNTLYDASGLVEIGHVNGRYLNTTIANESVTLRKQ